MPNLSFEPQTLICTHHFRFLLRSESPDPCFRDSQWHPNWSPILPKRDQLGPLNWTLCLERPSPDIHTAPPYCAQSASQPHEATTSPCSRGITSHIPCPVLPVLPVAFVSTLQKCQLHATNGPALVSPFRMQSLHCNTPNPRQEETPQSTIKVSAGDKASGMADETV